MVRRTMLILSAALLLALAIAVPAGASPAITGHHLWLNGERLGTVVVSSPLPNGGRDPIYAIFVNGAHVRRRHRRRRPWAPVRTTVARGPSTS